MFIELTRGYSTEIDDTDFNCLFDYWLPDGAKTQLRICDLNWHVHTPPHTQYARAGFSSKPRRFVHLHRLLTEAPPHFIADHKDRNGLNNKQSNLRLVSARESRLNTRKKTAKNRYRGVYWNKREQRWYARITNEGKTVWLGSFTDEIKAAKTYNEAAIRLHGDFAELNVVEKRD